VQNAFSIYRRYSSGLVLKRLRLVTSFNLRSPAQTLILKFQRESLKFRAKLWAVLNFRAKVSSLFRKDSKGMRKFPSRSLLTSLTEAC